MERHAKSQRPPIASSREDRPAVTCSHVTSSESRAEVVCKTTSVFKNILMTFTSAWILCPETMAAATHYAATQTGASSMV
ncbi:hypothetical protein TNCV_2210481 [Trichonephila clavipes]|nr:hypothetical protein TNCV_2210481 [Trichonephila clavipes]